MQRITKAVLLTASMTVGLACGLTEPKYIDYREEADGGTTDGQEADGADDSTAECTAAIAAFDAQIQPAVASSCAIGGCHLTQPVAGTALTKDNAATNRAQLLAYNGAAGDRLFEKYSSSAPGHTGGDQSASLPKATLDAWLAEEANCP